MFSEDVDNVAVVHQALDYLIANNYKLIFNESGMADKLMIAYPGVFGNGGKKSLCAAALKPILFLGVVVQLGLVFMLT